MTSAALLHHLSELAGIQPGFHDIWGNYHPTSNEARAALLGGLGLPGEDDAALAAAIHELEARPWLQPLPPVTVAPVATPVSLLLHLDEPSLDVGHAWRLELESGAVLEGAFQPRALAFQASRELDGLWRHAQVLTLPAVDEAGYHRLELRDGQGRVHAMPLVLHPPRCFEPAALRGDGRVWGLTAQLYGLRSRRNWGMGDFTDLRAVLECCAHAGAGVLGLNPLHALFPHNPAHCSPYSPSSRQFLNTLYIDVEAVPDYVECEAAWRKVGGSQFQAKLRQLREAPQVDYTRVAEMKTAVLMHLYAHFLARHLNKRSPRGQAFRAWQAAGGEDLERFALYQALQAHFHAQDPSLWGWPVWPQAYRDHDSAEVAAFAAAHREAVEYYQYLQWQAEEQLAAAHRRAGELGLGVGLYADLAVGVDKGGAEAWVHSDLYALDTRIGCPPDDFSPLGQDWGLPPWIPERLRDAAYAPYIRMLRANMRFAGALRIDHVMGLMRLFWVPPGRDARHGAYIGYPLADLLGILALESQRNRCLVIGEDLGTVPDEVRHALAGLGVLSYKLFYFERDAAGDFQPPEHYPRQSLVAASTHDLPTLAGWWQGADIDLRTELKLYVDDSQREAHARGREEDKARLLRALEREGLLPDGLGTDSTALAEMPPALALAIHRYLARSPAMVSLVQAEDMLGETAQANLPGTVDEHPNWRRKQSVNLEDWADTPRVRDLAEVMGSERAPGAKAT